MSAGEVRRTLEHLVDGIVAEYGRGVRLKARIMFEIEREQGPVTVTFLVHKPRRK